MDCWHAYVAGFFDGEGSISIVMQRSRSGGPVRYHKIRVTLSQREKHRAILDRVAADFGGTVRIQSQAYRISPGWASQAVWQLQDWDGIGRFLSIIRPYCIVKAAQVQIALDFVATRKPPGLKPRSADGRLTGRHVDADEIERRETYRRAMREANTLGPTRARPSTLTVEPP